MRAGRLRDKIGIQSPTETADEYGGTVTTWLTTATRSCDIKPLRASEYFRASGENVENVYEIRVRYERGLYAENKRLIDTRVSPNRTFDIEAIIDPTNMGRELVLTVVERKWPLRE